MFINTSKFWGNSYCLKSNWDKPCFKKHGWWKLKIHLSSKALPWHAKNPGFSPQHKTNNEASKPGLYLGTLQFCYSNKNIVFCSWFVIILKCFMGTLVVSNKELTWQDSCCFYCCVTQTATNAAVQRFCSWESCLDAGVFNEETPWLKTGAGFFHESSREICICLTHIVGRV